MDNQNKVTVVVPQDILDKLEKVNSYYRKQYGFDAPIKPFEEMAYDAIVEGVDALHRITCPELYVNDYQVIIITNGVEEKFVFRHNECDSLDDFLMKTVTMNPDASTVKIINDQGLTIKVFFRNNNNKKENAKVIEFIRD